MADPSAEDEESAVERQLELHLEEQRESLFTVKEALTFDPANPDLIAVLEELQMAITDAEDGLLHLKRSRLLKEADLIFAGQDLELVEDVKVEPLDPKNSLSEHHLESYTVGSKCRFRHSDGRWYNGHIVATEGAKAARITFLTPTSESMLMCKFFLQQRCHFGNNCRMSHGFSVAFSSLKPYAHTEWHQSLVGSSIWAISGGDSSIWRRAELESWDDELCLGQVVFQDDGSSAKLGSEALSVSEHASAASEDDEVESLGTDSSSSSEEEDEADGSVRRSRGFLEASASLRGVQTETAIFATWEHHTRGIASKMMASMGFRQGMGLGISGQGMVDPIPVRALPSSRKSLDHAVALNENDENNAGRGRKRSRGGRRKREKKIAEAAKLARAEESEETDVFSFINHQLAGINQPDVKRDKLKRRVGGDSEGRGKVEDRRSLVAHEDEVKELRNRVERMEEMASRNRKDKTVFEAASRKLAEARRALTDAEAARSSASDAVTSREKEKRWLKF